MKDRHENGPRTATGNYLGAMRAGSRDRGARGSRAAHRKYRCFRAGTVASDDEGSRLLVLHRDLCGRIFNLNGVCQSDSSVVVNNEFTRDAASFRTIWAGVSPFVTIQPICRGTFLLHTIPPVKKDDLPLTDNKGIGFIGPPSRSWERRMRTTNNKAARALHNAIAGAAGMLALALILTGIVRVAHGSPHVGDIVAFVPSVTAHAGKGTRLLVHRQDQFGCVLDLNVLRQSGGSLIVETQFGAGASGFRVHWAGVRTSEDPGNCGSDADLIVDHSDLDKLSLSAGGYGVGS